MLIEMDFPPDMTLGEIGEKLGETPERIADAITAARMLRGEQTYIS